MGAKLQQQRIIALQAALRIARNALQAAYDEGTTSHIPDALDAIDAAARPAPPVERRPSHVR